MLFGRYKLLGVLSLTFAIIFSCSLLCLADEGNPGFGGLGADSGSDDQNQEVMRKVMGDNIPDFKRIWDLPSLTDDQRNQLKGFYSDFQNDVQPIQDELSSIQQKLLGGQEVSSEQIKEAEKMLSGSSGNLPAGQEGQLGDPKLLTRVNELRDAVKARRQQLWQQVKGVLTDDQIQQVQNF